MGGVKEVDMFYTENVWYNSINRNAAATCSASGCVTSLVELISELYHDLNSPTNIVGGLFALETKTCTKCKREQDVIQFSKDVTRKDGLFPQCNTCLAAYRASHREGKAEYNAAYREAHREDIAKLKVKYREEHRAEIAISRKAYRAAHRQEIAASFSVWQKSNLDKCRSYNNKRRAHRAGNGGSHTAQEVRRQGCVQGWLCWWCGNDCKDEWHEDHLIPLSRGGHNDITNIVISCPTCNLKKHNKTPDEFAGRLL